MLRFAIVMAVGASFVALISLQLMSTFVPGGAGRSAQASSAPSVAHVATNNAASAPDAVGETSIEAGSGGQYATEVYVNGVPVKMLVDTGATMVVISHDTASRLGLQVLDADYTKRVRTANGIAAVAPIILREVSLGSIYLGDVEALVAARDAGAIDLLGMSFLKRLASVEQKSGRLILRQ